MAKINVGVGSESLLHRAIPRRYTATGIAATRDARAAMAAVSRQINGIIAAIDGATPDAILAGLLPIFQKSQEYCPVETGVLVGSGYVQTEKTWRGAVGNIGYALNNDPDYAAIVHERVDLNHEPPTQAKFLELAIMEEMGSFKERVVSVLRSAGGFSG